MGAGVAGVPAGPEGPRSVPTTGMRGGLGRTLLTAFLILTIVPLGVIGGYAIKQNRRNLESEVGSRLLSIAALKEERLLGWFDKLRVLAAASAPVAASAPSDGEQTAQAYGHWWQSLAQAAPDLAGASVLDERGQVTWATEGCRLSSAQVRLVADSEGTGTSPRRAAFLKPDSAPQAVLAVFAPLPDQTIVLCLETSAVERMMASDTGIGDTGRASLVRGDTLWPSGEADALPPIADDSAIAAEHRTGPYQKPGGTWVVGAYVGVAEIGGGILVEQGQDEVFADTEKMVATLIAMVLAVALATTAISAMVIRQITRPVIDLTESALAMSEGNLDQHVSVRSRDEIGILTYVFNEMATELKSLYGDLEAKVVERTKRLQHANYQIQRRALHLEASQQVSQAITSIRDPELLLSRVTDLIRNHFVYSSVAVYLVAPGGGEARLQASSPLTAPDLAEVDAEPQWAERCRAGDGTTVGRAIRKGSAQLRSEPAETQYGWFARMLSRVAIPLKMEDRIVGAIAVKTTTHEGIQSDELEALEVLANQVTIALENARAYERERAATEHLEAAEAFKSRFLSNMSRELRDPLNTVIGFSRLLMKGLDGPLNPRQLEDVDQIHNDSQRLLYLINDILATSEIQAGLMELRLQPVDLAELVDAVMPTASALASGKDVVVRRELPDGLPWVHADPARLRQVLVHLLTNAAKFTQAGWIAIRAWANEEEVYVSVNDTGIGIPVEDRERIFSYFEKGRNRGPESDGIGLGLALCREYVGLHGGQMWVDSEVGVGSTFSFSVPAYVAEVSEAGTK